MTALKKRRKFKRDPELMRELGRKGGATTVERHGSKYFSNLSKKRTHFLGGRPKKKKPETPTEPELEPTSSL